MSVHPGSIWLENNWTPNILPDGQWVAADYRGVLEHAPSLALLYQILLRMNVPLDTVTIAYIWFGEIQ